MQRTTTHVQDRYESKYQPNAPVGNVAFLLAYSLSLVSHSLVQTVVFCPNILFTLQAAMSSFRWRNMRL